MFRLLKHILQAEYESTIKIYIVYLDLYSAPLKVLQNDTMELYDFIKDSAASYPGRTESS